ncbi:hypothetical protein OU994_23110 [Pseudoduganella sp. SL102]|uniref:hypothetical protein n=1 Tax=Pseudoduganella sp. SL102 TaxID=2995154 RepID=UPI00248CC05F|nr:hypothetical protein [Pseudoduganella sp. SL102]WBS01169.1 hypothetical protein OU994_23110 [Pseudoduganella sp. SL102]
MAMFEIDKVKNVELTNNKTQSDTLYKGREVDDFVAKDNETGAPAATPAPQRSWLVRACKYVIRMVSDHAVGAILTALSVAALLYFFPKLPH